ncbi:hypothetical protein CYMTET_33539 [Cymbomonas tetramitiformis]|uniref:Photosynthesis system II assembly factor Ycf48/Hcf136-like domain-containing protein n=1 Tax=Cymbomonas tetramitiformis TaxID=36881 RepID=A0AAE0KQV2_9CHLO|nr:hypothetical protein CYMTET_33539 [Cymbomonas tetramitiformis]
MQDVYFVSELEGWVVSNGGGIAHTMDGGLSWEPQQACTVRNLYSILVEMNVTGYGWAVGDDGVICWSSDYGRSWLYTQVTEGSGAALSGVVSLGEEDAMVVGDLA